MAPCFTTRSRAPTSCLFNKVDLLPAENIPRYLEEVKALNPYCTVIPTEHCLIEPQVLWQPLPTMVRREEISLTSLKGETGRNAEELGYVAFAFETERPLREACFRQFIRSMPAGLYRIKGYVLLDDSRFFINHVGKKTEWIALETHGPTTLAFVGWKIYEAGDPGPVEEMFGLNSFEAPQAPRQSTREAMKMSDLPYGEWVILSCQLSIGPS